MVEAKKVILKNKNGELLVPYAEVSMNDIDNLAEDINNLIPANANTISGLGMPTTHYTDLSLGSSGSKYTAPANGWVCLKIKWGTGTYLGIVVKDPDDTQELYLQQEDDRQTTSSTGINGLLVPIQKGYKWQVNYNANGGVGYLRFIYAEGEVQ